MKNKKQKALLKKFAIYKNKLNKGDKQSMWKVRYSKRNPKVKITRFNKEEINYSLWVINKSIKNVLFHVYVNSERKYSSNDIKEIKKFISSEFKRLKDRGVEYKL